MHLFCLWMSESVKCAFGKEIRAKRENRKKTPQALAFPFFLLVAHLAAPPSAQPSSPAWPSRASPLAPRGPAAFPPPPRAPRGPATTLPTPRARGPAELPPPLNRLPRSPSARARWAVAQPPPPPVGPTCKCPITPVHLPTSPRRRFPPSPPRSSSLSLSSKPPSPPGAIPAPRCHPSAPPSSPAVSLPVSLPPPPSSPNPSSPCSWPATWSSVDVLWRATGARLVQPWRLGTARPSTRCGPLPSAAWPLALRRAPGSLRPPTVRGAPPARRGPLRGVAPLRAAWPWPGAVPTCGAHSARPRPARPLRHAVCPLGTAWPTAKVLMARCLARAVPRRACDEPVYPPRDAPSTPLFISCTLSMLFILRG
jgi:hypothetical protein